MLFSLNSLVLYVGAIAYTNSDFKNNRAVCVLQSLHITYFNLTQWFLYCAISFNLLCMLQSYFFPFDHKKRRFVIIFLTVFATFLTFVLPLIFTLLQLIWLKDFGVASSGAWCTIKNSSVRFGFFWVWAIVAYVFNLILFVILSIVICRKKNFRVTLCKKMSFRSLLYSITFLYCWFFGVLNVSISLFDDKFYNEGVTFLNSFFSASQTVWIALAFFFAESLLQEWGVWTCMKKCIACCAKKRNQKDQEIREPLVKEDGQTTDDTEFDANTEVDEKEPLTKEFENENVVNSLVFLTKMEEPEEEEVVGWMQEEPPRPPIDQPPPAQFVPVGENPDVMTRSYRTPKYASKKVILTKVEDSK